MQNGIVMIDNNVEVHKISVPYVSSLPYKIDNVIVNAPVGQAAVIALTIRICSSIGIHLKRRAKIAGEIIPLSNTTRSKRPFTNLFHVAFKSS